MTIYGELLKQTVERVPNFVENLESVILIPNKIYHETGYHYKAFK